MIAVILGIQLRNTQRHLQQTQRLLQQADRRLIVQTQQLDQLFDELLTTGSGTSEELRPADRAVLGHWQRFDQMSLTQMQQQPHAGLYDQVTLLRRLAYVELRLQQPGVAMNRLLQAVDLLERLCIAEPRVGYDDELAETLLRVGGLLQRLQQPGALPAYRMAAETLDRAVSPPSEFRQRLQQAVAEALASAVSES